MFSIWQGRTSLNWLSFPPTTTMQSINLLLWSGLFHSILISSALEYSNRWTVHIDGDHDEANRLARKHGFVNQGKVIDSYYCFVHEKVEKISKVPSFHMHKGLLLEPNVKMVEQQEMKSYKLLSTAVVGFYKPTDPGFEYMWYINRDDGQPTYNVIDVWKRNITGAGVVVAVVDEGFDPKHPEIEDNYDEKASWDVIDNDNYPVPSNSSIPLFGHGDKCAGVIAAVANNNECGVGLAYNAKLGGIRLFFDKKATDDLESKALNHEIDHIDIYSNSWGPDDRGFEVAGPGLLTRQTLEENANKGRRGLGSIYVFAAGNGGLIVKDSCAFNGYVNSIYTIAITGINSDGSIPIYGEHCAGIMAVTYSRDIFGDTHKVITADTNRTCTNSFGASSAAAAMASGLIALMLSANQRLSWRDVQHIIARTARPDPVRISESAWTVNKANLKVNDYVGFGLMDASKMVDAALNWTTVPPKVICAIRGPRTNRQIPSHGKQEEPINITNWSERSCKQINYLEHVEVKVNLTYSRRGDLLIKLVSPQGTVSNLTHFRSSDSFFKFTDLDWMLMSLHYWGENATGLWKLTLENSQVNHPNTGILFNWTLILHGTTDNPFEYQPTEETKPPTKEPDTSTSRISLMTKAFSPNHSPSPTTETPTAKSGISSVRMTEAFSPSTETPTAKSETAWTVGGVFAILVIVVVVGYYGYKKYLPRVPDPVAFYPLNSAFGTKEIKNRVAPGVPSGVTLAPGPKGEADGSYEFSGTSNSYIEFPNNEGGPLDVRHSMTMLCWVFHNGQDGPLFNYKTSGSSGVHLWVVNGKLFVRFTRRDYSFTTHLSHTSLTGGWKFVGASHDRGSGEAKLWVDGAVVQTSNIGASLELATQDPIRMGVKIGDRRYFKGRIAQMQVYNKALGQKQIRALKQRTLEQGAVVAV